MIGHADRLVDREGRRLMDWAVAAAPMPREDESGDAWLGQTVEDGMLIAAIDGAGHGAEAASAARTAAATLAAFAHESPISLVLRCHEGLRYTRGAVMSLAACSMRDRTLTWIGVGNVDAVLFHAGGQAAPNRLVLRGGCVGHQLPALRTEVLPLRPLDTLVMATDGIEAHFADALDVAGDPQDVATRILTAHGKGSDDALVVVARYLGRSEP